MKPTSIDLAQVTQVSPTEISIPQAAVVVSLDDLNAQLSGLQHELAVDQEDLNTSTALLERVTAGIAAQQAKVDELNSQIVAQQSLIDTATGLGVRTTDQVVSIAPTPIQPLPPIKLQ